jgi:hypothetical protein
MQAGGFDVIIGNPPWVEYSKVTSQYSIISFRTRECNNLWAFVMERSLELLNDHAWSGLIVPMSLVCTERMLPIQKQLRSRGASWLSNYESDSNPGQLFIGVKQNISIAIHARARPTQVFTTRLFRFFAEARAYVLPLVEYTEENVQYLAFGFAKVSDPRERRILDRIFAHPPLRNQMTAHARKPVLVHRIAHYYIKCFNFVPYFRSDRDGKKKSEDYKEYGFPSPEEPYVSLINSSLFYFYWQAFFDGFKAGKACVEGFPCRPFDPQLQRDLAIVCGRLMADVKEHSKRLRAQYAATGRVESDQFYPRYSKQIMDDIDLRLREHYGLTDDEVDYVVNYDIKYRMGQDGEEDDE